MNFKVDVVIQTHRPSPSLTRLINVLEAQTVIPEHILILNFGDKFWDDNLIKNNYSADVIHIREKHYDCGAVLNLGLELCSSDYILYVDQDAAFLDNRFIEKVMRPFRNNRIKAVFPRMVPLSETECPSFYEQLIQYPDESVSFSKSNLENGIMSWICPEQCTIYDAGYLKKRGGFQSPCCGTPGITMAAGIMTEGGRVAYTALAECRYNFKNHEHISFRCGFDLGVSSVINSELYSGFGSIGLNRENEMIVRDYLENTEKLDILISYRVKKFFMNIGFKIGRHYRYVLPILRRLFSNQKAYWKYKRYKLEKYEISE